MNKVFVDTTNLYQCCIKKFGDDRRVNYIALKELFQTGAVEAHGNDPDDRGVNFQHVLRTNGYVTRFIKAPEHRKCCTVEIIVSILRMLDRTGELVVVSSDYQLAPFVDYVQSLGIPVWIIGIGVPRELRNMAQKWTELDETYTSTTTEP